MSPRDHDPERLARRIEQGLYHEAEIQKRREAEREGAIEWCRKHSTHETLRRDGGPIRDRTVSKNPWE